jgi:antitoxin (DNA-binding transcriptional repressor) of toxin-antitoxin stability system
LNNAGDIAMTIHNVSLQEAESHLSDLIKLADQGNDVVITNDDGSSVRLVSTHQVKGERVAGLHRGKVHMNDNFDDALDDSFLVGKGY